jgi:hypothetical protein
MLTARPPLNESTLRFQYARLKQEEASLQRNLESCQQQLVDLKTRASASGLSKLYRELENPPAPVSRGAEPTLRVRVVESFSQEWDGLPYDALAGAVVDLPRSFVKRAKHLFEEVASATPLFTPAPGTQWPRAAAPAPSPLTGLTGLMG